MTTDRQTIPPVEPAWKADRETRDWLRRSVEVNAPTWTSIPPGQMLVLLDALDEAEAGDE